MGIRVTFDEVLVGIEAISAAIRASDFSPHYLVGLARGGWIPTRLLSNALGIKELLSIGMKYGDAERKTLITYSKPDPIPQGKRLLLIEDCLESGRSLWAAREMLVTAGNDVKTASVYITDKTEHFPDFYFERKPMAPILPWE